MEFFINRYRNLSVLVLVIVAQLLLLAYQVKGNQDVRLIRIWAVTAITPVARALEAVRTTVSDALHDYVILTDVRSQNLHLRKEIGKLKMENQFFKEELATADRARALSAFQSRTPSRTIAARVIGSGTGADAKVVFIDRGSASGVAMGMAVVTPDGIVGKVRAAYPTASQVVLITDRSFAAGVVSQKNHFRGTLKGQGGNICRVDYVQNEERVDVGEWVYTSGDDRVFPRGLPAGRVTVARPGTLFKEIYLAPSGFQNGVEEVLIVLEGVHQPIPDAQETAQPVQLLPPPTRDVPAAEQRLLPSATALSTDADRLRDRYKRIGEAQDHVFGEGLPGSRPPDFNMKPDAVQPKPPPAKAGPAEASKPAPAPSR